MAVLQFNSGKLSVDVLGGAPPVFTGPAPLLLAQPLNPDAPWRDGPQGNELTICRAGGGRPQVVTASGVACSWEVERQQVFSAEVDTGDLLAAFGTVDLRGFWVRWTHPTLGVWAGEIADVEASMDSGTTELAARDFGNLLTARRLTKDYTFTGTEAGAIAKRIVTDAGRIDSYNWITTLNCEEGGAPLTLELRGGPSVLEALETVRERSGQDFWVDENRILWWQQSRGDDETARVQLVEGRAVSAFRYVQSLDPIVNDLLVVPADERYARSQAVALDDDPSIKAHGRRQGQVTATGMVTRPNLLALAQKELKRQTALGDTIDVDVANVDGCWALFREGDSIILLLPSVNRRLQVRVLVRSYDSDSAVLHVSGDVEGNV